MPARHFREVDVLGFRSAEYLPARQVAGRMWGRCKRAEVPQLRTSRKSPGGVPTRPPPSAVSRQDRIGTAAAVRCQDGSGPPPPSAVRTGSGLPRFSSIDQHPRLCRQGASALIVTEPNPPPPSSSWSGKRRASVSRARAPVCASYCRRRIGVIGFHRCRRSARGLHGVCRPSACHARLRDGTRQARDFRRLRRGI